MMNFKGLWALLLVLLVVSATISKTRTTLEQFLANGTKFELSKETKQKIIDRFGNSTRMMELLEKNHAPGITLNIVYGDEIIVQGNFGLKNVESKKAVDENTLFRLGSISKMFQAITFLSVAHLGDSEAQIKKFGFSFNLGTTVHEIISKLHPRRENFSKEPKIVEHFKTITLYNLFTHSGGFEDKIPNLFLTKKTFKNFFQDKQLAQYSQDFMYADLETIFSSFKFFPRLQVVPPNEMTSYSNILTGVIGWIAELIEKKPLHVIAKERIFEPLQMTRSQLANDVDNEELSDGYAFAKKYIKLNPMLVPLAGIGALQSSSKDIINFMKFANAAILPESEQLFASNPKLALLRNALLQMIDDDFIASNLGNQPKLLVKDIVSGGPFLQALQDAYMHGLPNWGHAGGLGGFASYIQFVPALNIGFMTSNNAGNTLLAYPLFLEMINIIMEDQPIQAKQAYEVAAKKSLQQQVPYSALGRKNFAGQTKIGMEDLLPYVGTYKQMRTSFSDYLSVAGVVAEFDVSVHNASEGILALTCPPWSALRAVTGAAKILIKHLGGNSFVELGTDSTKFISLSLTFFHSLDPTENHKLSFAKQPFKYAKTAYAMSLARAEHFYDLAIFKIAELLISLLGVLILLVGEIIFIGISLVKRWKIGFFHYLVLIYTICIIGHFVFIASFFTSMEVTMDPQANKLNGEFSSYDKFHARYYGYGLVALSAIVHISAITRHMTVQLSKKGKILVIFLIGYSLVFSMFLFDLSLLSKENFGIL